MKSQASNQPNYYRSGDYLRAKHRLAGDNFARWVIAHILDWRNRRILDAGGGWGRFIWLLLDDYGVRPEQITLTDMSHGMLKTAADDATKRDANIALTACDIQALPFASQQFDIVMANKVLYHLNDIALGVSGLARVLKSQGQLIATTNSDKITAMIIDFHYQALDVLGIPYEPELPSPFSMENGGVYLSQFFGKVTSHYYQADDYIDDASRIRATYETIGRYRNLLVRDAIDESRKQALPDTVEQLAQAVIDRDGYVHSPTLMGVFVCSEPKI